MRILFIMGGIVLLAAGLATYLTQPEQQSEVPVIYWVIDPAPARPEQIAFFHKWLIRNHHGQKHELRTMEDLTAFRAKRWSRELIGPITDANAAGARIWDEATTQKDLPITVWTPGVEMKLDSASNDLNKKLVQGLSGVGGDVIEAYGGGKQMQYLAAAGMLADVTDRAKELGFSPAETYKALRPALFFEDRQYAFPRNPAQTMYWVNKETFEKYSQPLPPSRWTFAEFERLGKTFVAAANPPGKRQTVFFADGALPTEMRRSLELSIFNETLTRCTLDDPRNAEVMALIYKWTYQDHILPSAADKASFDTEGGWGGQSFQLFKNGRYALFASGRWALMLFRRFGAMPLAVSEPPYADLPNTILSGGQSTVYAGSKHREYAELFLAYMAGEDYNMQIVRDGDALPPNPKYTRTEAFLKPPDHPNEWGCHEAYAAAAETIAITQSFSPYVLPVVVERYDTIAREEVMNDRKTPQEAADGVAARINDEIRRTLQEHRELRQRYERDCARQTQIEQFRKEGRKVPLEWLSNPFYQHVYVINGWSDSPGE